MLRRVILALLLYISSLALFAQQKSLHLLQMICLENKLTATGVSFKLAIINTTADTFSIPKKIFSGCINSGLNMGYEVQYIDECGISRDLTKNLYEDIHYARTITWNTSKNKNENKNSQRLLPGTERIIDQYIGDDLLDKKGYYLVRFSIKKGAISQHGISLADDFRSDWIKVLQIKDKIYRKIQF